MRRSADNTAVFRVLKICGELLGRLGNPSGRAGFCTYSGIERKRLRDEFYFHGFDGGRI